MPITRKPKSANGHAKVDVNALIARGGTPSRRSTDPGFAGGRGADIPVILRIPETDLLEVDMLVGRRQLKTPRHRWLLEAIHEKIARERKLALRA